MTDIVDIAQPFRAYSFRGGSRRDVDPTELRDDQYLFLQNGRVRYGSIEPVNEPDNISQGLPTGNRQGLYIVGNLLLAFIDGRCYYRDLTNPETTFLRITAFQMSVVADRIYIALVPSSTLNLKRQANENGLPEGTTVSTLVTFTNVVQPSPVCIVCQDGISRPQLILNINNVREASDIDKWHPDDNREYVPIGLNMLYYNGKLYIVAPSKREIYDSVSGRPLDFVKAVDPEGNKLDPQPDNNVEASRLSHNVDYDEIQFISTASNNGNLNGFMDDTQRDFYIVSTKSKTYMVTLDYINTIYAEPRFRTKFMFPVGTLNQSSMVNMLGDTGLIDLTGLKSFNSILSLQNDGSNSDFSKMFDIYFKNVQQDIVACESHDNYVFFAVKTVYGYKVVVFDLLSSVFVSLDDWGIDAPIFQFAASKVDNIRRLFFMTTTGAVYEAFAGEEVLNRILFTKEWIGDETVISLKPKLSKITVQNCKEDGTIFATSYVDRLKGKQLEENIKQSVTDEFSGPPYGSADDDSVRTVDYSPVKTRSGLKVSLRVECKLDVEIFMVEQYCEGVLMKVGLEQQATKYK